MDNQQLILEVKMLRNRVEIAEAQMSTAEGRLVDAVNNMASAVPSRIKTMLHDTNVKNLKNIMDALDEKVADVNDFLREQQESLSACEKAVDGLVKILLVGDKLTEEELTGFTETFRQFLLRDTTDPSAGLNS